MSRFKLLVRLLISTVFASSLFFTTLTSDFFDLPKTYLLYGICLLLLLALAAKFLISGKVSWVRTQLDLPLLLLTTALFLSTYFGANRTQSALNGLLPLGLSLLFYFLTVQLLDPWEEEDFLSMRHVFIATTTLLGLMASLSYFNIHLFPFDFAQQRNFSPVGGHLTLMALLALSAPLALGTLLRPDARVSSAQVFVSSLNLLLSGLLVLLQTSLFGFILVLPVILMLFLVGKEALSRRRSILGSLALVFFLVGVLFYPPLDFNQRFLDFRRGFPQPIGLNGQSSWVISIQTVRDYPFFGSGPGTFLADFVRYRPISLNYTPSWNQRFGSAAGEPYQVLATLGIFGLFALALFLLRLIKLTLRSTSTENLTDGTSLTILSLILILFFSVPANFLRTILLTVLALVTLKKGWLNRKEYDLTPFVPLSGLVLATVGLGYLSYKLAFAEFNFKKAADAALVGDTNITLNNLAAAIRLNPSRDNYHLSLANLAYSLANRLAAKQNLTESDQQTLVQLLNTAIAEAKAAVALDPFNGVNLEALASIYRNISGAVPNATTWTITAYQQAMQIEPTNPELPFRLGSLFYAAGNFEQAANLFAQAVNLKNDFPNYRYNLAWALKNRNLLEQAANEMTITSRLVEPQSEDGKKVLADLQEFLKAVEALRQTSSSGSRLGPATAEGNLAAPQKTQVNLTKEASPSSVKRK